jgi:glycosyltransferase 2 family protein
MPGAAGMDTNVAQPQTAPNNGEQPGSRGEAHPREAHPREAHARGALHNAAVRPKWTVQNWALFLLKNVIGWALILASFVLGPLVPGPGGIPIFLLGFGLITFPGKRKMTARVLSGKPTAANRKSYRRAAALFALVVPAGVLVYLIVSRRLQPEWTSSFRRVLVLAGAYVVSAVALWFVALRATPLVNWFLRMVAKARRKSRPWMRRHGIDLLPPRRRIRYVGPHAAETREPDSEILDIRQHFRDRLKHAWTASKPWLRRSLAVGLTVAIFYWILKPIVRNWGVVEARVWVLNWGEILLASVMFALFLFFRAMTWRRILRGMGYKLPVAPAVRIWATSELARYLPGAVWQVVGRVYLARPYGIRGSVTSTSQIFELAAFLLANLIVAVSCLLVLGWRNLEGPARIWLVLAAALVPALLLALHPKVFYGIVGRVLTRLGKPQPVKRLGFRALLRLLFRSILMLLWQGLAIWLVVHELLNLPIGKWWVVTGAYCLAWCAGFLAFWAPGGLGVREAVFIAAMGLGLQYGFKSGVPADLEQKRLFLIFLSVLLRIWATAGELMLTAVAYLFDYRGAMNRPDAPGRKPLPQASEVEAEKVRGAGGGVRAAAEG